MIHLHKNIFAATLLSFGIILVSAAVASAQAVTPGSVRYPIPELGNCTGKEDCREFCEKGENMLACVNFAEKKGMITGEDLRISKIVAQKVANKETPGGCSTKESCETYCSSDAEHLSSCISFGEELGVIPASELAEAKKIASALAKGAKMPGACKTKNECENFCSVGSHIDECLNFAEAANILSPEALAEARKVAPFLKNGETPGKCQTKETCDAYCDEDSHFEECIGFAEKAGFISSEDAVMAKKVGGKGPGECKGKEECLAYCDKEENAADCASFAKEKGLLTEEQEENINTGVDRMKAGLEKIPPEAKAEIIACLENSIGKEKFDRIMAKQDMPTMSIGKKIEACFGKIEEIMKTKMMQGVPSGAAGAGAGGSAPSKEEIMKNIPSGVPDEMRERIEKQIEAQTSGSGSMSAPPSISPSDIPSSGTSGGMPPIPVGAEPGTGAPSVDCSMFAQVPSCDYVQGAGHDLCEQCKGR